MTTKLGSLNECRGYLRVVLGRERADAMNDFELAAAVRPYGAELATSGSSPAVASPARTDSAGAPAIGVQRFDVGRLDRAKRTGAGGARVPATISRTGVQVYTDEKGRTVREYRPPESVFAADSLDTLGSIPVTVGHPPAGVSPQNYRQLSVGHVSDAPTARRKDGPVEWLDTAVVINDADTLRKVESGDLTEVSMGYLADVVPESGVAPSGEHYDAVQRNIRFNHLALLQQGRARAGSGARLRLDSAGNQLNGGASTKFRDRRADAFASSFCREGESLSAYSERTRADGSVHSGNGKRDRRADAFAASFKAAEDATRGAS